MKITVLYFASIREALGISQETVITEATTVGALRDHLVQRGGAYTGLATEPPRVCTALNQQLCHTSAPLSDGAEVAFFPPVTGG